MTEPFVTRRELDLLKADADLEHAQIREQLRSLDDHGSRGVAALQVRMDAMVTSMADLKADMKAQFAAHDRQHEKDEAKRVTSRRWLVATVIAAVATVDGPLVTLLLARR